MADRVPCQVIGCGRSIGRPRIAPDLQWLCSDHWRLVSPRIKRLRARVRRELKRGRNTILDRIDGYLWREAKRQAIERAMGIRA